MGGGPACGDDRGVERAEEVQAPIGLPALLGAVVAAGASVCACIRGGELPQGLASRLLGSCLQPGLQRKLAALGQDEGCVPTVVQDGRAIAGDYYRACSESAVWSSALAMCFF